MKKKLLRKRIIIPLVIIIAVVVVVILGSRKSSTNLFMQETVAVRDLTTYLKFTGKLDASDTSKVFSSVTAKVKEVVVEEGQKVKKGDVICYLDSDDIEYAIESKEVALEQSKLASEYNLKDARTNLNNLQSSVNQGLNSSVNMAQKTLLNEQEAYYRTVDSYNTAMEAYIKAKADYDSGKTFEQATNSVNDAQRSLNNYNETKDYPGNGMSALYNDEQKEYVEKYTQETYEITLSRAQKALEDAKKAALDRVNDLKEQADTAYENVVKAESSMASAKRDYDTAILAVNQNLQTLRDTVERIEATTSTKSQELDIEHSKDSLENYTIVASMDGYITTLNCKVGEYVSNAAPVAIVSNFDKMEVSVKVDEYDIGKVKTGTPVSIYVNAFDTYFDGQIESIDMTATNTSDVSFFNAKVSFETDGTVMSGLSAEAKIVNLDKKNVKAVLADAVSYEPDNTPYCYVRDEKGNQTKKVISLGDTDGTYIEIVDGLSEGDVIYYTPKNLMQLYMMNN